MNDPADPVEPIAADLGKSPRTIAKRTLAERIAERRQIGQLLALTVIQDFLDDIAEELSKGNRLEFRDFGVFETVTRRPRMALNPKTLEKVPVKARKVVKFKPGRLLKERVQQVPDEGDATPPVTA